jgi:hypothetical protein
MEPQSNAELSLTSTSEWRITNLLYTGFSYLGEIQLNAIDWALQDPFEQISIFLSKWIRFENAYGLWITPHVAHNQKLDQEGSKWQGSIKGCKNRASGLIHTVNTTLFLMTQAPVVKQIGCK